MTTAARGRVARRATERFVQADRAWREALWRGDTPGMWRLRAVRVRALVHAMAMEQNAVRYWRRGFAGILT